MYIPKKFKIQLQPGIFITDQAIIDKRLGLSVTWQNLSSQEQIYINKLLKESEREIDFSNADKDFIEDWKQSYLTIADLNLFRMVTKPTWVQYLVNPWIIYKEKKLHIFMMISMLILIGTALFFFLHPLTSYLSISYYFELIYVFYISLLIHELAHAFATWRFYPKGGHGYFIFNLHGVAYVTRKITASRSIWIALAGPIAGLLIGGIWWLIVPHDIRGLLIMAIHLIQLSPWFPDGKCIWRYKNDKKTNENSKKGA
ncbi:hypothetical protein AB1K09_01010 [Solibacillus silvestris]